ncbi:unnamed protein product [Clonostachys byssicola]|uniref:Uncharacterized protein n=1 Tax=Clonostachys byssicola TaxID=160290 RepID=A0A9N9UXP1_9HYPO|nr:unnamed protein product [Clonostachys byssicola]
MGPVIPPSIYPTTFPLPPLPDLECPENLDKHNFKKANHIVTKAQDALPYGPIQFWWLLHRYYVIAKCRFGSLSEILQRRNYRPFRLVNLDRTSDKVQILDLLQGMRKHLGQIWLRINEIENEVHPPVGAPGIYDLSSSVPNLSLRECRLWCMLNTKGFHKKLRDARGEKTKLDDIIKEVAAIICARDIIKDKIPVVKLRNSVNIVTPYMIFVCFGQTENGDRVHDLVHIGCTREWMTDWAELFQLRDDARNSRLGEATINAWRDWYDRLVALDAEASAAGTNDGGRNDGVKNDGGRNDGGRNDGGKNDGGKNDGGKNDGGKAISNMRTALLKGDENALSDSGKRLLAEKLRACDTHQGQAFRQLEWFQVEPAACCYVCKSSMNWKEVSDPDIAHSVKLDLLKRRKCPHSCAEVVASGYCDYITRQ